MQGGHAIVYRLAIRLRRESYAGIFCETLVQFQTSLLGCGIWKECPSMCSKHEGVFDGSASVRSFLSQGRFQRPPFELQEDAPVGRDDDYVAHPVDERGVGVELLPRRAADDAPRLVDYLEHFFFGRHLDPS